MRNLLVVVHELMEFGTSHRIIETLSEWIYFLLLYPLAYDTIWLKNMLGFLKAVVKDEVLSRRGLALRNDTEFYFQISNMATLAFSVLQE